MAAGYHGGRRTDQPGPVSVMEGPRTMRDLTETELEQVSGGQTECGRLCGGGGGGPAGETANGYGPGGNPAHGEKQGGGRGLPAILNGQGQGPINNPHSGIGS